MAIFLALISVVLSQSSPT